MVEEEMQEEQHLKLDPSFMATSVAMNSIKKKKPVPKK
jgi:hypothetical protein